MKVAITMRPVEKGVSGSGMHLGRLLSAFVNLSPDCEVTFLRNTQQEFEFYAYGETLTVSRNPVRAAWELRDRRFDIVHYSPLSIFSPLFIRASARCATLHPDDELIIPECYSLLRRLHSRHLVGAYARKMDRIFTVSETSRRLISGQYRIPKPSISLTGNAVDAKYRILPRDELGDARDRFACGKPFLLHVSNLSERKNPWTLLRAWGRIARSPRFSNFRFVIVGNGWDSSEEVRRVVRHQGLEGRLRVTGFIDEVDILRLMNLAELFVFPSLSEGFGMPNLEAMACGCPVITSDAFAIPEVVGDAAIVVGRHGSASELAEQITRVVGDRDLQRSLRERGLRRVREFSWEQSARVLLRGYESML